jgi:hypothetical protein
MTRPKAYVTVDGGFGEGLQSLLQEIVPMPPWTIRFARGSRQAGIRTNSRIVPRTVDEAKAPSAGRSIAGTGPRGMSATLTW